MMQDCNSCDRFHKCIEDGYLEDITEDEWRFAYSVYEIIECPKEDEEV